MTSKLGKNNIAIIPARSSSKGLRDKNIRIIDGKPLMAYSIEAAIKSKCFETVFVSTDSEEYAKIARKYGADVPFLRDIENAKDTSSSWDVIKETLMKYKEKGKEFNTFMLLQPTSPFRSYLDIKKAYRLFDNKKANSVVSVYRSEITPFLLHTIGDDLLLQTKDSDKFMRRRQDLEEYYIFNGAIYLSKTKYFLKKGNIYGNKCYCYKMSKENSIDIDDEDDLKLSRLEMKRRKTKK